MIRKEILELEFSDALITIYKYLNERGRVLIEGDPNGIELTPQEMIDFGWEIIGIGKEMMEGSPKSVQNGIDQLKSYKLKEEEWKVGDRIRITSQIYGHTHRIGSIVTIEEIDKAYMDVCYNTSKKGYGEWISKEEGEKVYE